MAQSLITAGVQKLWSAWNIRGFVILSLFLQVLLASIAPLRKKSNNRFLVFVIWSAYFLADWAATYTFGLISNARCNHPEVNENLLAFWAAFLLIHLGGPDMITKFSLEDDALWTHHLVELVTQVFSFFNIFLKTSPGNDLVVPTILIAVAGAIKYGERTRAQYIARMDYFMKSLGKSPKKGLSYFIDSQIANSQIKNAFHFMKILKGLVVDIAPDHMERLRSHYNIWHKDASETFRMIATQLNNTYELFYTKIVASNSPLGLLARAIAYYNIIVALVLFCLSKKEGFHEVDIWITFFLLACIIAVETFNSGVLILSDWSEVDRWYKGKWALAQGLCFIIPGIVVLTVKQLIRLVFPKFTNKVWCEKLGAFNLLFHCFRQYRPGGNKIKKYALIVSRFFTAYGDTSWNAFDEEIWRIIFQELKQWASSPKNAGKVKMIFETRGGWTLMESENNNELMQYLHHFDYDRSLLTWHIATEICYNNDGAIDVAEPDHRKLAKMLSDYMNYLLIKKPEMISFEAWIGHVRFHDTCTEITHFSRLFESKTVNEFCTRIVEELTSTEPTHELKNKGASVLSDACNLAIVLRQKVNRWEIISQVWLEMLMYAAVHCRPEKHVQALCEGGELVTIVWQLGTYMRIGSHFPNPEED